MSPRNVITKMLKVCYRNGYFCLQSAKNSETTVQWGPLGTLLRRNVWREWLSSNINNNEVSMFPIEVANSKNHSVQLPVLSFLPIVLQNYIKILPYIEKDTPCGFATYGSRDDLFQSAENSEPSLLGRFVPRHGLQIVFFSPFRKSTDWFNYWARYRYRWWRKFSSIPSKFSMSDVTETKMKDQQISLMMEFPWGVETIETITLHGRHFLESHRPAAMNKVIDSSVIVCASELNLAAFSHLSNSFAEKWRDDENRRLFHLHSKLAPYKVCISVMSENSESSKLLKDVAQHIEKDLKKHRVTVFPYCNMWAKDKTSFFTRYDEMGVPYTVVLDDQALHSGIAYLRNRDTTLQEQVHISELTPKLIKYLQMKSFDVDEL